MKTILLIALLIALVVAIAPGPAHSQDGGDRVVINLSDPSRPALLKVNLLNSEVRVRTHTGRDIIVETGSGNRNRRPDGLRRIGPLANGLNIEEENNVVSVTSRGNDSGNVTIQVPVKTNLNLRTVNGGDLRVDGVEGEIEATNTNGSIVLNNVAGSVIAHGSNGSVTATLREITPNKPMWFTSVNAHVDITLPSNAKANLKILTDNGESISDFEIELGPGPVSLGGRRGGNRHLIGKINGGGPEFELRTLNGNIYIRKGK